MTDKTTNFVGRKPRRGLLLIKPRRGLLLIRILFGKNIFIPRIALDKTVAQRGFAFAVKIAVRRIEIIEAVFNKGINHFI